MSILVIGANGGVGSKLVSQLNEEHVDFTAGVRKEDQVKELENKGIKATLIDVEKNSIDDLKISLQIMIKSSFRLDLEEALERIKQSLLI